MLARALLCAALLALATAAQADPCEAPLPKRGETFSGAVRYVGDGDGLCVSGPHGLIEVRLADFYAPELQEPGGPEAKAALSLLTMGRQVVCIADRRSYDRVVAVCRLGGVSVGDLMRGAGVAEGGRGR